MSVPRVLNGRYEIGELLGRGGMADVYMARDTLLGRTVAVKLLRGDVARDSQLQARFRREAQAVAGLNHPSIVAVYDTGEHANGDPLRDGTTLPYIVMEYVHGKTLRDLIHGGSLSIEQSTEFTLGVLAALEYSHRASIVHRDIKPANVMVTEDSEGRLHDVKVMDFGIARTISDSSATMTQTQTVMGTAQYLSPEQARGEPVDARSDLYSAACLFYEMLASRPPFVGDSPVSVAYQHVREVPPAPSNFNPKISAALDSVLLHALQKDREDRFQDAASFRRALRAARTGVLLATTNAPVTTDPVETVPMPPAPSTNLGSTSRNPLAVQDDGPSTRAMAKVLAGGALTHDGVVEEDPREPAKSVQRRRRAWTITLFVFLALILGGGAFLGWTMMNSKPPAVVQVAIPSLAGFSEEDAMAKLSALGLEGHHAEAHSTTIPSGKVIRTNPQADIQVNLHSTVDVVVSTGPSAVTIPTDLAGKTESEVRGELSALNLVFKSNQFVDNGQILANLVVTTDPEPGKTVPVGSSITLKISSGLVVMPSLFELTSDPAAVKGAVTEALANVSPSLTVDFEEAENSAVAPGMVIDQSETSGSRIPQRTRIVVTLAKEPAKATPTPTPSATPKKPTSPSTVPPAKP
ncbi:Stk1 family PASTA domain-containing Ser/Thr kinase [Arthrobacter cryoconiti]|uniref:non-specific serine/threonine protein kinase n=1 Tax=Arthrobacter cryoconiti TaxID=748907 RepID=A0ABV8R1S8_9MICC|nr:Stk1 family PASTA domain-containing Ser/Thr kinase [Arthrobacter cryoconiti]MCC9067757.1 Stk1 family PASTA domain-containing Ser/Thr kinase [Arthrobacter cryoconiti]